MSESNELNFGLPLEDSHIESTNENTLDLGVTESTTDNNEKKIKRYSFTILLLYLRVHSLISLIASSLL